MTHLRRIESAEGLPEGTYNGVLSGYHVAFTTPHGDYEGRTIDGIRGSSPIVVDVKVNGRVELFCVTKEGFPLV